MHVLNRRPAAVLAVLALTALPLSAMADGVSVRFDMSDPTHGIFPSNRFSVPDWSQATYRRVNLPKPDCKIRPSDCADITLLNQLDGFSTQPRITVPFTGAIDVASVNSNSVYLVNLGDTQTYAGLGEKIGINQILWDPATNTLVFQPDALLNEHTRYAVIVTNDVRDASGKRLKAGGFGDVFGHGHERDDAQYQRELHDGLHARPGDAERVVAGSVFTTQSISAGLYRIMKQLKQATPAPVSFIAGTSGGAPVRAVFPTGSLANIAFHRQTGVSTSGAPVFTDSYLPTPALQISMGAVGQIAYGTFDSPDYQNAAKIIPQVPTLNGTPVPQGRNKLTFQLFVPSGAKPAGGWPVAIFGHGFTDSMYGAPWAVASTLASRGIATVAINVVGHGGGAQGTLTVNRTDGAPVTINAGGRGFDQDGNGTIDSTEGVNAIGPYTLIGNSDSLRQTTVDLMQLVREIEVGMDIDGDGVADLNAQRIYYAGQSFGGIYGTILLGVEPNLKAGVPNVPGGSITEVARLGAFRPLTALTLLGRTPSLLNVTDPKNPLAFNENIPLRNLPPVINNVPGAMEIAKVLDWTQWVQQPGNPVSYAAFIRKHPLPGNAAKPVIIQFAKGDGTVPNPTATAILRAGDLAGNATFFRNDLAYAANPTQIAKNPHTFLTNLGNGISAFYAVAAQTQIAEFFRSNGTVVIDPDGAGPIFETPIGLPLPEGLNYLP